MEEIIFVKSRLCEVRLTQGEIYESPMCFLTALLFFFITSYFKESHTVDVMTKT